MKQLRTIILIAAVIPALVMAAGCAGHRDVTANPGSQAPVKSVMDHYLRIQSTLAEDSMDNIPQEASAIAAIIRADNKRLLNSQVAKQADALAKAKDLGNAREDFKALSAALIQYMVDHKMASDTYTEVYCPMAEATWLQKGEEVKNPYMGESMPGCGIVKRTF